MFNQISKFNIKQIFGLNNFINMFDAPIRRRIKNYPKDFTPPSGYLTSHDDSKPTISSVNQAYEQYSFNAEIQRNEQQLNFSTQLASNNKQLIKTNLNTINPQETRRMAMPEIQIQTPLKNNITRRKPHINPDLLLRPRIQVNPNQQLIQKQDEQESQNNTPGSIRKNIEFQKPLLQEQPSFVSVFPRDFVSNRKVSANQNIFYQSLKSQNVSISNLKTKRFPMILRNGSSQTESVFRIAKRLPQHDISQSNLQTRKEKSEEKKNLIEFGHLLQQKRIDKLKAHINQIAFQKSKNKPKLKHINEPAAQQQQIDNQRSGNRKSQSQGNHFQSNRSFYAELGYQVFEKVDNLGLNTPRQLHKNNSESETKSRAFSTPRPFNVEHNKKISISYKTSFNQLKQIYKNISLSQNVDVEVLVPRVLMTVHFDKNFQKQELYSQASLLFENLGIPVENLTIKRYSNCILMVSRNICILWHYGGKVYLGGWQVQYLDEGVKHGLGLEWVPNKYVYYGEYCESKKEGLGIMKTTQETFIGEWAKGKRTNNGNLISRNGEISHPSGSFNYRHQASEYDQFESDPFL